VLVLHVHDDGLAEHHGGEFLFRTLPERLLALRYIETV